MSEHGRGEWRVIEPFEVIARETVPESVLRPFDPCRRCLLRESPIIGLRGRHLPLSTGERQQPSTQRRMNLDVTTLAGIGNLSRDVNVVFRKVNMPPVEMTQF